MIDLKHKVAIVTGGSRGIGAVICEQLARAGADIAVACRSNIQAARQTAVSVEALGRKAITFAGDLGDPDVCADLFAQTREQLGAIDIVVGNAGVWKRAPIDEMTPEQWREMTSANLDAIYNTCHQASRYMAPRKRGNIILIASTAGQRGEANYSHYAATKGAVIAFTRSLAAELGPKGVNVNCVAPGWVLTEMTDHVFEDTDYKQSVIDSIPVRRIATAADVAGPVVFLASDLARHVQGAVINVNGGSVLC